MVDISSIALPPVACVVLLFSIFAYAFLCSSRSSPASLPPGPRPLPFIGNAHQITTTFPEKRFAQWAKQYGDIVYINLFGRPVLVLNSTQVAFDLLEKRGTKYANRPPSILFSDLLGWGDTIPVVGVGIKINKLRRWFHNSFYSRTSLEQFEPAQAREVRVLLTGLGRSPQQHDAHIHCFSSALILEGLYGHIVTSNDDQCLHYAEAVVKGTKNAATPGSAMVDFLPILRHIPAWMPAMRFKRDAEIARVAMRRACRELYALVQRQMVTGDDKPSFVRTIIEECIADGTLQEDEDDIMRAAVAGYVAGLDTIQAVLRTFLLAMVLNPNVYAHAQEEIDRVVGNGRLPELRDRNALPFIECVLREVYRWNPVGPLGVPHALSEDDGYRGYHIPKGCVIIPNIWAMTRDPCAYPDPTAFRPDRFYGLSEVELEKICPRNVVFGFGRRICPGRRFADTGIWLAVACIAAVFDIRKARDAFGAEITPRAAFTSGVASHPEAFSCSITPRKVSQELLECLLPA